MTRSTQRIVTFLGLFASIIICVLTVNDINQTVFMALAGLFLCISGLSILSSKFAQPQLSRFLEFLDELRMGYLALFITFYKLSIILIEHNYLFLGLILVILDYVIFYSWVSRMFGREVLRPVCNKFNVFQPSVKLPEEFNKPELMR
jgi:hypothetical protein